MGEKPNYPRRATIDRLVTAARAAGIRIGGLEFDPDGTVRILAEQAGQAAANSPDAAFDRWVAKQNKAA